MLARASSSAADQSIGPLGRVVQNRLAALAGAFQLLVEHESSRRRLQSVVDLPQPLERDGGLCSCRRAGRCGLRHRGLEVFLGLQRRERLLEHGVVLLDQRLDRVGRLRALRDERSRELLAHRRVRGDRLVHQRLRERRLVALVVAVSAVADQIDQEVALESAAILPGESRRLEAGRGIVSIDMDDRDLEAAGESARVAGAVRLARRGREAELIVGDDVNRFRRCRSRRGGRG